VYLVRGPSWSKKPEMIPEPRSKARGKSGESSSAGSAGKHPIKRVLFGTGGERGAQGAGLTRTGGALERKGTIQLGTKKLKRWTAGNYYGREGKGFNDGRGINRGMD